MFSMNLRNARRARRLSLRALGERVGVTGQAVLKWEQGKSYPASSTLVALSKALNVGVECLMTHEVCIVAPPPRVKPPKTNLERSQRWAAAWGQSARRWRAWAQSRSARAQAAEAEVEVLTARVAALEAALREHRRLSGAGVLGEAAAVLRRAYPLCSARGYVPCDGSCGECPAKGGS
jgi:transcriptional regulator with XRE-family HTH domain